MVGPSALPMMTDLGGIWVTMILIVYPMEKVLKKGFNLGLLMSCSSKNKMKGPGTILHPTLLFPQFLTLF